MDKFEETFSEINSDDIVDVKDISEDPFDDEYQVPVPGLLVAPIIGGVLRYRSKCQICSDYALILMFSR